MNVVNGILNRLDPVPILYRDFDAKLLLHGETKLNHVKTVKAEVEERCVLEVRQLRVYFLVLDRYW